MDAFQSWAKFLHPETLKSNLLATSLYIVAWESLCNAVVKQLYDFYHFPNDHDEGGYSEDYKERVLAFDRKSELRASLLWFKDCGAIDDSDIALVDELRRHRNEITHELPAFISQANREVNLALFEKMLRLISKVDRWWILNIELDCNPEFDKMDRAAIADDEVSSGRMVFLSMLFQIATGDGQEAMAFYNEFVARAKSQTS